MTYAYDEGTVPVPAQKCTRCGGALEDGGEGDLAGWFTVSTLTPSIWIYSSADEPQGKEPRQFACRTCERTFHLHA
jgi:hypothetical protein